MKNFNEELNQQENEKQYRMGKDFFRNICEGHRDNPKYFKKDENGNSILFNMQLLLKEQHPEKYEKWLQAERERYNKYYEKIKKIKVKCECGCVVVEKYMPKHLKTNKHKKLMILKTHIQLRI
jgi:hypothetical protein